MKVQQKDRRIHFIVFPFIICLFFINLYSQNPVVRLPNGETRYLTQSEPLLYVSNKNGKVTSVESINLEEEIDIIVSLKGRPLCLQERSLRLSKTTAIQSEHDAFRSELNRITGIFQKRLGNTQSLSPDYRIKHEYFQAFNGFSMTCKRGIADMIRTSSMVENVYRDGEVKINLDESVSQIGADHVRDELGFTGEGVVVGIVDTGIDYMHPALGEGFGPGFRVIGGYDFENDDADPVDDMFHGTHVAGIVGANSDSLIGVAPGVHFIAAKVLDENGSGLISTVLAGIDFCLDPDGNQATDDAVDIINMSFGVYVFAGFENPMDIAINNASEAGILCVVAAGNSGKEDIFGSGFETISSPGTAEKALTVGACDSLFTLARFSSKGPDPLHFRIKPEVVAPGVGICSSLPDGETARYSGTSMATPHVAGVAALLKEQHPDWMPEQLKWAIVNSANPLDEEYNAYRQGSGCVDAWKAAHQNILIEPGILSFGMVNLELAVWRDTVSFTIRNTGAEFREIRFAPDDHLPAAVQLNLSRTSLTLGPGEEDSLTAEIVVPSSVPIMDEEPFSYFGNLLCTSGTDTTRVPYGFLKANMLVVECDIAPYFLLLWDPNSVYQQLIIGTGEKKYYLRAQEGNYNILTSMYTLEDTTTYFIQRTNVEIGGLTYQTISHEEAEFYAFPGPVYDMNNNLRTDEDLIGRVYDIHITQSQGDSATTSGGVFGSNNNVYISPFDSSLSLNVISLWKPTDDLLFLNYQIEGGIENTEDLIPPSGSENLLQFNVHFCDLNENLILPGLDEQENEQIVFWNRYEFSGGSVHQTSMGTDFEEMEYSRISFLKSSASFNLNRFNTLSLGMIRENREFHLGDLWTEDEHINIFERAAMRDLVSEQMIKRYSVGNRDTLQFNPGEEIYLPVVDNFIGFSNIFLTANLYRVWWELVISPTGIYEPGRSRTFFPDLTYMDYCLYDRAKANPMMDDGIIFRSYDIHRDTRYRVQGNTRNYYLLGQNGHTTVDYEFHFPESGEDLTMVNPPNIDHMIVLSNDKVAQWLAPGNDNKIRLLIYDANHDVRDIQCFLIPSSGEKIALSLDVDTYKREVIADIPSALPHEFIDLQVIVTDAANNRTSFTAAPAFFFGSSMDERTFDSRVFMNQYNLENVDQFPFSAGDSLSFTLDFTNNGNLAADSIVIKYPPTSMFQPADADSVVIGRLSPGDSTTALLHLRVSDNCMEDKHFVYTPEVHWKTNGKSCMRRYPVYIKTWQAGMTSIDPERDVSADLSYQLYGNYPNPFNTSTTIAFQLPETQRVRINIYNILGELVKTLANQEYRKGYHEIVWDGSNAMGETATSGIYFVRIQAGDFVQTRKMFLLK